MKHKGLLIALAVVALCGGAFLLGLMLVLGAGASSPSISGGGWPFGGKVGVITIDGTILSVEDPLQEIDRFRRREDVKAVVVRLESPGGSVAAAQELFEAVKRLAGEKPVVVSMGSVAASGAYYIACGATKILANPGTITGSIGVRMEHVMLGDLLRWTKIQHETLKSGRFKDLAAFDRPMTPEEREILQGMLDDIHLQFKEAVAASRNLSLEKLEPLADGRVYTGRKALDLGLVDELGGFDRAVRLAAKLGGIRGEPRVVRPEKRLRMIERILESATTLANGGGALMDAWEPLMLLRMK